MNSFQLMIESLAIRFLHIIQYPLDYRWGGSRRTLRHTVLWYVHRGSFHLEIGDTAYRCSEGQVCILPAGSLISFRAVSDELLLTSINFDAEVTMVSHRSWAQVINAPVRFEGTYRHLEPMLQEMLMYAEKSAPYVHLLQQSALLRILYELLHTGTAGESVFADTHADTRIHTIIHFLNAHPHRMPEIKELAELVQLSESHLRKLFIKQTGQAPLHFVHSLKIEQAKKQLTASSKPVSQIAYELGIDNANYFSRMFRLKTGLTPLQYRQQFGLWLND
ncbi:helix-turn-helix domain-containing protein [Paenibacillus ferrarius]|uniref:helix-turn-helix domain-containing protein n=1 Tax=Paenibacillus ferrarius TaxID=1469647 RepID=UPI003D27DC1D